MQGIPQGLEGKGKQAGIAKIWWLLKSMEKKPYSLRTIIDVLDTVCLGQGLVALLRKTVKQTSTWISRSFHQ